MNRTAILLLLAGAGGCLALGPQDRRVDLGELRIEDAHSLEIEAAAGTVRATGEDPHFSFRRVPGERGPFRGPPPPAIGLEIEIDYRDDPGDRGWDLFYLPTAWPGAGFDNAWKVRGRADDRGGSKSLRFDLPEPATRLRLDPPPESAFEIRSIDFAEWPAGWRKAARMACAALAVAGLVLLVAGSRALRPFDPEAESPPVRRPPVRKILVVLLLAGAIVQIAAMVLTSRYDSHPDERDHAEVAEYYVRWWLPPAAGDPRVIPSISKYGVSYHYSPRVNYFLAGKAVAPVERRLRPHFQAFRLFNLGLFAALAVIALRRRDPTFALLLLLLPAQVWYLFSYFNDDALALFACLLCCWQLVGTDASFARFLSADGWTTGRRGVLIFALLAAVVVLSKKNYHLFLVFVAFYALWMVATSGDFRRARNLALKWGLVALLAFAFAGPRLAVDRWVDEAAGVGADGGLNRKQLIRQQAEQFADPGLKPSELGEEDAFQTALLKKQGVPFHQLFTTYRWHELSFKSFVGLYGYMDYFSLPPYYLLIFLAYAALLVTLGLAVWRNGTFADRVFGLACALFAGGFVLVSALYSWTVDLQPQGRYLFPLFAILFAAVLRFKALIPPRVLWGYALVIFLLSSYSFLFTALRVFPNFAW